MLLDFVFVAYKVLRSGVQLVLKTIATISFRYVKTQILETIKNKIYTMLLRRTSGIL